MRHPKHLVILIALALAALVGSTLPSSGPATAADNQKPQGLVVNRDGAAPGYTLFAPLELERTYLMDMKGKIVHTWKTDTRPGLSEYLLPNGHLLRAGNLELANGFKTGAGAGGRVEELDWDGNLLWRFDYASDTHIQHHDIAPLPNGNVLILAWERKSAEEAIAAGRSPKLLPDAELWPDSVVEYSPTAGTDRVGVARVGSPRAGPRPDEGQLRRRRRASGEDRPQLRARGQRGRQGLEPRERHRLQRGA